MRERNNGLGVKMSEKLIATIIIGIAGTGLTFARRYNNQNDKSAGLGVAGWTIFIFFLIWL